MKRMQTLISVGAVAAVTALPVFAQQAEYTTSRVGNESAEQIANRVGACGQAGIDAASFDTDNLIRVECASGSASGAQLEGGLATGAAIAGGVAAIALIGLASDDSGSTTSTPSTPGTSSPGT